MITPVEYIQQVRIEHAKKKLVTTDMTIAEVGVSVGLPTTPYFITLFKKRTQLTPARYRQIEQQIRKENHDNEK